MQEQRRGPNIPDLHLAYVRERLYVIPRVLTVVVGPTGVGKTEVQKGLTRRGIRPVILSTNRPPRPGEEPGINFYFATEDDLLKDTLTNNIVQAKPYDGYTYWTLKSEVQGVIEDKVDKTWVLPTASVFTLEEDIRKAYQENPEDAEKLIKKLQIIYLGTPDIPTLIQRVKRRGQPLSVLKKRAPIDSAQFRRGKDNKFKENIVINEEGKLEETLNEIHRRIIKTQRTLASA